MQSHAQATQVQRHAPPSSRLHLYLLAALSVCVKGIFREVTQAGVHSCTYCMDYEDDLPIYVCRKARTPFREWWPSMKWYGGARK